MTAAPAPADGPLGRHVRSLIAAAGPLRIDQYMTEVLLHPVHGYYAQGRRVGAEGDFTTAPEISQMFGELVGLWLADRWQAMGAPAPVRLVELGPGRGTLMADILRAVRVMPALGAALDLHLVESNRDFRAAQRDRGLPATWHNTLDSVPTGPMLLVANEFFDALPIRQWLWLGTGWAERAVGLDKQTDRLVFTSLGADADALPAPATPPAPGTVTERCPAAMAHAHAIARRLACDGGAALIVDYGYAGPGWGDTFQAVAAHRPVDPLAAPGAADLTAHVDFTALARAAHAAGAAAVGPVDQGTFLDRLGLGLRAGALKARAGAAQAAAIDAAVARLTAPEQMGTLFKALALTAPGAPVPPGFAAEPCP
ncbi:hypothetical protein CCR85_00450 [Rhodothalassium salexigens]|uniref:class I SAM-dependent methyltransferase n=1 Tax=Rhodothalassium salexigens TaxID=1086 RepID=UPI0019127EEA|nr:SAM-dependent methyltransferase [Rhodothalassium salexigens]MBK5909963.1 hypothetical protein [Rhodothalassium salexigens]MBK5921629.1 hypothetical protein [Rhodothalassium salexigens]